MAKPASDVKQPKYTLAEMSRASRHDTLTALVEALGDILPLIPGMITAEGRIEMFKRIDLRGYGIKRLDNSDVATIREAVLTRFPGARVDCIESNYFIINFGSNPELTVCVMRARLAEDERHWARNAAAIQAGFERLAGDCRAEASKGKQQAGTILEIIQPRTEQYARKLNDAIETQISATKSMLGQITIHRCANWGI